MFRPRTLVLLALSSGLVACQSQSTRDKAAEFAANRAASRTIAEAAQKAAVSKPGAQVCRQVAVGIAEVDWIRGRVSEIRDNRILVRLDNEGRFPQTFNGVSLAKGTALWDEMSNWVPCSY